MTETMVDIRWRQVTVLCDSCNKQIREEYEIIDEGMIVHKGVCP
jgi:hypothetical protein